MTTHPEPLQPLDYPRLIALDMALRAAKISPTHRPPATEILGSADTFLGWLTMPPSPPAGTEKDDDPARDPDPGTTVHLTIGDVNLAGPGPYRTSADIIAERRAEAFRDPEAGAAPAEADPMIVTDPATLAAALHLTNGVELPWTFDVAGPGQGFQGDPGHEYRWSIDRHGVEILWGERDTDPTEILTSVVAALNAPATEGRVTARRGSVEVSWPAGWQAQAMEHTTFTELADRIAVLTAQRDELLAQSDATRGWRDILGDPTYPVDPGEVVRWLIHHHPHEAAVMMHRLDHLLSERTNLAEMETRPPLIDPAKMAEIKNALDQDDLIGAQRMVLDAVEASGHAGRGRTVAASELMGEAWGTPTDLTAENFFGPDAAATQAPAGPEPIVFDGGPFTPPALAAELEQARQAIAAHERDHPRT